MRRLLAAIATICLLGATPPANYNAFGIAVLQRLAAQAHNQNVFISPVSLGVALAMAADGAAGSTRTQMLAALRVRDTNLAQANAELIASLQSNHDATIGIANALWLRQDIPPRPQYVSLLTREYRARAQALHFGDPSAAAAINAWTRQHTLGLIDNLVDSTNANDYAYLTNALAFEGKWAAPFEHDVTSLQAFTDASGRKHNVEMMSRVGTYQAGDGSGFRALSLPYGHGSYAAYILLPSGTSASALAGTLSASTFDHLARANRPAYLRVSLPRFTIEYQANLPPVLKALGIQSAFNQRAAEFAPMTGVPHGVYIASVVHKAYVRVDESGTTAAAATSVGFRVMAIYRPSPPPPFIVDKPFVLALRDEHSGTLLFIGVINSITQ